MVGSKWLPACVAHSSYSHCQSSYCEVLTDLKWTFFLRWLHAMCACGRHTCFELLQAALSLWCCRRELTLCELSFERRRHSLMSNHRCNCLRSPSNYSTNYIITFVNISYAHLCKTYQLNVFFSFYKLICWRIKCSLTVLSMNVLHMQSIYTSFSANIFLYLDICWNSSLLWQTFLWDPVRLWICLLQIKRLCVSYYQDSAASLHIGVSRHASSTKTEIATCGALN